jgi:hypothetical protein
MIKKPNYRTVVQIGTTRRNSRETNLQKRDITKKKNTCNKQTQIRDTEVESGLNKTRNENKI